MKVIIAGSRTILPYAPVLDAATKFIAKFTPVYGPDFVTEIVGEKARGVDTNGELWAEKNGIAFTPFPAPWDKFGCSRAGKVRNQAMADYVGAIPFGGLLAVWDGDSTGTADMIERARAGGLLVEVVKVKRRVVGGRMLWVPTH